MEKEVKYTRIFYDVGDNELKVIAWLRKHGGKQGEKWRECFMGKHYTIIGWDNEVGTVGDLLIEIFDPALAFEFEISKVGGTQRDRKQMDISPFDDDFDPAEDDFIIDT